MPGSPTSSIRQAESSAWTRRLLATPAAVAALLLLLMPLLMIVGVSFLTRGDDGELVLRWTGENYRRALGYGLLGFDPFYPWVLARSLGLAAVTTLLCLVFTLPTAFCVRGLPRRWKPVALMVVLVPFWTNLVVRTYGWQVLLSPGGWVTRLAVALGAVAPGASIYPGSFAVYVGMLGDFLPFMFLPIYAAVERLDWGLVDAAADLGAGRLAVFRHALVPQLWPAAIAGVSLVFLPALSQFLIPELLGGGKTLMLGSLIQQQFGASRDWPFGAAVAAIPLGLLFLILPALRRLSASTEEWEG